MDAAALGTDYAAAKQRCDDILNPQFTAWRVGGEAPPSSKAALGTFDWMVATYKTSPKYQQRPLKYRKDVDAALGLVSKHMLKDGRLFGTLALASITPGAADRLFVKLKEKPGGGERVRTAKAAMDACRRAWNVARRDKPEQVPLANPFHRMDISYTPKRTPAVPHGDLDLFVSGADEAGYSSVGTAAMIAFFWLQREVDILSRLSWNHYRPADMPDYVRVFHHKTGRNP
jgi:hypothetical protein